MKAYQELLNQSFHHHSDMLHARLCSMRSDPLNLFQGWSDTGAPDYTLVDLGTEWSARLNNDHLYIYEGAEHKQQAQSPKEIDINTLK